MDKIPVNAKCLTFLNAAIITAHGVFEFQKLTLKEAREIVNEFHALNHKISSAIGHAATAELMTRLLKFPVPENRIDFIQTTEDAALVFKLRKRASEGVILTREELEEIGYEFGLLTRTV
ncbi:MAG: YddF family protein [Acidobacteriota bacterium]|nr:YddF family protein [Acidobacteriota bacterium]